MAAGGATLQNLISADQPRSTTGEGGDAAAHRGQAMLGRCAQARHVFWFFFPRQTPEQQSFLVEHAWPTSRHTNAVGETVCGAVGFGVGFAEGAGVVGAGLGAKTGGAVGLGVGFTEGAGLGAETGGAVGFGLGAATDAAVGDSERHVEAWMPSSR